jgi:hypothetical protein
MEDMEDVETVRDTLEAIEEAFEDKAIGICKLIRLKELETEMIDKEMERLNKRKAQLSKSSDWLRSYLQGEMERTGKDKIKTPLFNVTLANNPPSVRVLSESIIPETYKRTKIMYTFDKQAIKAAIEQGQKVAGVELVQNKSLRLR